MNEEAQKVQDEIDRLIELRDKLRGNYLTICGYCYHNDHKTFVEHIEQSPSCYLLAWPCPLGIYDSEWARGKDGRWNRLTNASGDTTK